MEENYFGDWGLRLSVVSGWAGCYYWDRGAFLVS